MATKSISIAKETTSQEILTKLATALTQAQNNGTNISSVLNQSQSNGTNIATLLSNLSKALTQAQTNGTNINSVKSSLANGISAIKSVQKGYLYNWAVSDSPLEADISTVDPDKCVVIINGHSKTQSGGTYLDDGVYLSKLEATKLTIGFGGSTKKYASWQVIEFA